jgi:dCTP deaminase
MLLSYLELIELIEQGVIDADPANVNPCSIDVRLGDTLIVENAALATRVVDLSKREVFNSYIVKLDEAGYRLRPGQFVLAHTMETFNLPNDICAEFKLKSSGARTGLENALATWCDPGWHGSKLTLELTNLLNCHDILIRPGDRIGQMIFYRVKPVPEDRTYAKVGRYNNDTSVQAVKL